MQALITVSDFIVKHGVYALNNYNTFFADKQRTVRMSESDIERLSNVENLKYGFRLYAEAEDKGCVWLYPNDKIEDIEDIEDTEFSNYPHIHHTNSIKKQRLLYPKDRYEVVLRSQHYYFVPKFVWCENTKCYISTETQHQLYYTQIT